jgi:CDP-glycerol glycerophosphotransferase
MGVPKVTTSASTRESGSELPHVSVIIPAYNAMPHVIKCVTSVLEQTIEAARVELIVVDDGSTDGTGDELDRMAELHFKRIRVFHQKNSGGPSSPRNVGLNHARGRYVFFLDADDYLGSEALARLLESAESNGSDIVLGKLTGVGGRRAGASMFKENQSDANLFSSRVYWTLNALKLFRRDLIERLGLRFPEDLHIGEDQPFTAVAYLNARRISVVADYECYYAAYHVDGNHVSKSARVGALVYFLERMTDLIGASVEAGPKRDLLLRRHFEVDLFTALRHLGRESDSAVREQEFTRLVKIVTTHHISAIDEQLRPMVRLQLHLVQRALLTELLNVIHFDRTRQPYRVRTEDGRAYAMYPYFRDAALGVPDGCFDITSRIALSHCLYGIEFDAEGRLRITGHAYLVRVDHADAEIALVMRRRGRATEHRMVAQRIATEHLTEEFGEGLHDYDNVGFQASIDLPAMASGGLLFSGLWDMFVTVTVDGVVGTARLGHRRPPELSDRPKFRLISSGGTHVGGPIVVAAYFTNIYGNLSLDVGGKWHTVVSRMLPRHVGWVDGRRGTLRIDGRVDIDHLPTDALSIRLIERSGAVCHIAAPHRNGDFVAFVPLTQLPWGDWTVELQAAVGGAVWRVGVPRPVKRGNRRWSRLGLPGLAKPIDVAILTLRLTTVNPRKGLRRRFSRFRRLVS